MKRTYSWIGLLLFPLLTGCGSGIQEALILAGESGARTFLDILLSDLVADLPDYFSFPPGLGGDDADDGGDGDGGDGDGDGVGDGGDGDGGDGDGDGDGDGGDGDGDNGGTDLVGDAVDGEALFTGNCAACHCASAAACGAGQIDIEGIGFSRLQEKLLGEGFHGGGKFPDFTEQDLADLAAFLGG